jgi:hypothetical protein
VNKKKVCKIELRSALIETHRKYLVDGVEVTESDGFYLMLA